MLEWVLRTALPLRPDFGIWLNGKKLIPSKEGKGRIKKWVLGKDITTLPRPAPKDITADENKSVEKTSDDRSGLDIPILGRVTGYAEAYQDLLTGNKADAIGRSNGFFVYVFGRLVNVIDGHFGIPPDELRHGTFGRFRLVINIDSLDDALRSNRETISEGPLLEATQNVLRAIFNAVRSTIEKQERDEEPGAKLARKLAESPASLSRRPVIELARAVAEGKHTSRYLTVPKHKTSEEREVFLAGLEKRVDNTATFITGLSLDYKASAADGIAFYDTDTGILRINALHPFVAAFYDDFSGKSAEPLELFAMAEVVAESQLYAIGVRQELIDDFLTRRDELLRYFVNQSGRKSAFSVALALQEARNDPDKLEEMLCAAFTSLGFEVSRIGGRGKPDGVATALLPADSLGHSQKYAVSLDAKSKVEDKGKVAAGTVKVSTIVRHRSDYHCQHALVVGRAFPTAAGQKSALIKEIDDDRKKSTPAEPGTITLVTIDDLARLVRIRPLKQLTLIELRGLFQCRSPEESAKWIDGVEKKTVKIPPYSVIVNMIEKLQKERHQTRVSYNGLAIALSYSKPPVIYETDEKLHDICRAMAQMAEGMMFAGPEFVELNQSASNVIISIEAATKKRLDDA